jgi:hypothetical protein
LRLTHLVTTDMVVDVFPQTGAPIPMVELTPKTVQDRFASKADDEAATQPAKSTRTAEVLVPTGATTATPAK